LPRLRFASALFQAAFGFLFGFDGYMRYAQAVAEGANRMTDEIGLVMGLSGLSIFTYALLTPRGLVSTYLFVAGTFRAVATAAGPTPGDPILSASRELYARYRRRTAAERAEAARHALEGPETPDVLERGPAPGHPDAEWVLTASRMKAGWEKGVFVVTTDRWYRIAGVEDRRTQAGLRRVYVLDPVGQAEVIRRSVYYDHPALSALHEAKAGPGDLAGQ
jgi:hypothetical protein